MASAEVSSGTANSHGGEEETRVPQPSPGFRFQPTDQEIISCYLKDKIEVLNRSRFSSPVDVDVDHNKIEPWDLHLLPSDAKMCHKHQTGVDVSTSGLRYVSDSAAYSAHHDEPDQWVSAHHDGFNMAATPKEEEFLHFLARASKPSDDRGTDSACNIMPEVILDNQVQVNCTGNFNLLSNLSIGSDDVVHSSANGAEIENFTSGSVHLGNIDWPNVHYCPDLDNSLNFLFSLQWKFTVYTLANDTTVREVHLVDGNHIPIGNAVPTQNGPHDAKISGKPSARRRTVVKICSDMEHRLTYLRFSASDILHNKIPWATRIKLVIESASAFASLLGRYLVHHRDLKPENVLLDEKTEKQLSGSGRSRLLHSKDYAHIPTDSVVPTHNGPLHAKFSGKSSAERGIELRVGSYMTNLRTYLSVQQHPFMQMLPSARKWIASKWTFGDMYGSLGDRVKGWISEKPKYETPNARPVSEYIIRKLLGIWNGLTVNESQQHSAPDSCRSGHGKMAVNTKISASWIVATAAPHHATGNRNLLSGFTMEHDDQFVHGVNRVPMKVLARGAVVTDALVLPDVWFVPGLKENLVSVSQLAELDHSIGFGRGECCIRSARDAKIVGKGRLQKGGNYVLDYLKLPLAI